MGIFRGFLHSLGIETYHTLSADLEELGGGRVGDKVSPILSKANYGDDTNSSNIEKRYFATK